MTKFTPLCKPLRIIELVGLCFGFTFLFLLRKYDSSYDNVVNPSSVIFLFSCYGTFLVAISLDVVCQLFKEPVPNIPMIEVLVTGLIFCFVSGLLTLVLSIINSEANAYRTLNVLSLLSFISFCMTVIFGLDLIIITKYI